MAEMNARERHLAEIRETKAELDKARKGTPHWRDIARHLHQLEKELRIYDFYTVKRG